MNLKTLIDDDLSISVKVTNRDSLDNQLDAAVSALRERAMSERLRGILVTRYSVNEFTVALSDKVPFGLTQETRVLPAGDKDAAL